MACVGDKKQENFNCKNEEMENFLFRRRFFKVRVTHRCALRNEEMNHLRNALTMQAFIQCHTATCHVKIKSREHAAFCANLTHPLFLPELLELVGGGVAGGDGHLGVYLRTENFEMYSFFVCYLGWWFCCYHSPSEARGMR